MSIPMSFGAKAIAKACEKDAKALKFIQEMSENVDTIQEKILAEILSQNSNTEYLQRFKLDGATDRDSFKSKVPIITYEDIKLDIERVMNGDTSPIFSSQPITEFIISTGTSCGEGKLIPSIHEDSFRRLQIFGLLMPVMNIYVAGLDKGKGLYFLFTNGPCITPGGIPAHTVLTSFFKTHFFKDPNQGYTSPFTSPIETISCIDPFQSMYSQMLCGLIMREDVVRIGAVFAPSLLRAIRFLQLNWKQLSQDIETGTLSPNITDISIRQYMSKILKPNPELAQFITEECEGEKWDRIIPRIWPNTKYIDVTITGTMAQYIQTLEYYGGGLPLASTTYASSECYFGLNLYPMCKPFEVSYTIMPNMAYFEFIHHDSTKIVDLANVEVGKEYELVITTHAGLCRYRMGDILRVTGFCAAAPQFKFVKRMNVVLSVELDKTTEPELQNAVENASALLRQYDIGVEYTSYVDIKTIPGHYVIYWELIRKVVAVVANDEHCVVKDALINECCSIIEESLSTVYRQRRASSGNLIGPLEIRVVKNGTFDELMDYAISRGASINQYKVPKCVNFTPIIELLDSRVVSVHFSPAAPHWTHGRQY